MEIGVLDVGRFICILLLAAGFYIYNRNLRRGKILPPLIAFIIGSCSATTNAIVFGFISHRTVLAIIFGSVSAIGNSVTLYQMWKRTQYVMVLSNSQTLALSIMFIGFFALGFYPSPLPAAICALVAGYCSMFGHWANVWKNPEHEKYAPWALWLVGFILMTGITWFAPRDPAINLPWDVKAAPFVYPVGFSLSISLMLFLISRKEKRAS